MSTLITLDIFKDAIKTSMKTPAMQDDAAKGLAEHVLNFFGFQDRIIDNMLEPEDRDAFYMLEDVGLLTTEREETGLPDGREWRIHYWLLRDDKIVKAQKQKNRAESSSDSEKSVYDTIPDDIWFRREVVEEPEEEEEESELDDADWETPDIPGTITPEVMAQSIADTKKQKKENKGKKKKNDEEEPEGEEKTEFVREGVESGD